MRVDEFATSFSRVCWAENTAAGDMPYSSRKKKLEYQVPVNIRLLHLGIEMYERVCE